MVAASVFCYISPLNLESSGQEKIFQNETKISQLEKWGSYLHISVPIPCFISIPVAFLGLSFIHKAKRAIMFCFVFSCYCPMVAASVFCYISPLNLESSGQEKIFQNETKISQLKKWGSYLHISVPIPCFISIPVAFRGLSFFHRSKSVIVFCFDSKNLGFRSPRPNDIAFCQSMAGSLLLLYFV